VWSLQYGFNKYPGEVRTPLRCTTERYFCRCPERRRCHWMWRRRTVCDQDAVLWWAIKETLFLGVIWSGCPNNNTEFLINSRQIIISTQWGCFNVRLPVVLLLPVLTELEVCVWNDRFSVLYVLRFKFKILVIFLQSASHNGGWYSGWLRAGWSGDLIHLGSRYCLMSRPFPVPTSFCTTVTGLSRG
jgi:hypothetical protein